MLLTISTSHQPATDLGYLLHKNPSRCQSFELSFGKAHVFYTEANESRCTACLLLDVDPVGLVRGKGDWKYGLLDQYVNDRPYVASSFMSVAISQIFGSALTGRSKERPHLVGHPIPLTARIDVLPVRGDETLLRRIFEPLGYSVSTVRHPLDDRFPGWGDGPYYSVQLQQSTTVTRLLQHLYVLIPVFDGNKHYYIGQEEVDKLLSKGATWLGEHPEKELIAGRYLNRRRSLIRQALARLVEDEAIETEENDPSSDAAGMATPDAEPSLHDLRLGAVLAALRSSGAKRVVDVTDPDQVSAASDRWPCANSRSGSKRWSDSSAANRSAEFTNAFSAFWPWKVNWWILDCSRLTCKSLGRFGRVVPISTRPEQTPDYQLCGLVSFGQRVIRFELKLGGGWIQARGEFVDVAVAVGVQRNVRRQV